MRRLPSARARLRRQPAALARRARAYDQTQRTELGEPRAGPKFFLGRFNFDKGLEAGKSYTRSEQFTLPENLQGFFEIVVETNVPILDQTQLYEGGTIDNNVAVSTPPIQIILPDLPDLQVQSLTGRAQVQAGGTVDVEFTVIN